MSKARRAWMLLWIALAAAIVVRATSRCESRGVILDHLEFGRRLLHGEDVYGPWKSDPDAPVKPLHGPYPPSFGLLTAPFAVIAETLGLRAARAAWALLQVACLLATALVLRELAAPRAPPSVRDEPVRWHWLWLLLFVLGARFVLRDTHGGGGNVVNVALSLLAFAWAERGRPRLAGLCLGLSLATKPTQVWLPLVLLALGRGRAVAWTVVTAAVAVAVTFALQRFDAAPWLRWAEGSFRLATQASAFAAPALDFPEFEWMNQSLRCAIARWCGEVPDDLAARVAWGVAPGLALSPAAAAWIARLASLGLLAAVLVVARRCRGAASARAWTFAAALVLSVLLSPLSWKAHHVVLLPVLWLVLLRAAAPGGRGAALLLAAWALCCLPGKELVGDDGDEWLNSVYVVTAWDLVLLAVALRAARSASREDRDAALPDERREVGR
jgi:hypothetical protein